ncbi:hypothetical protein IKG29_02295 [Candidatus Saccharibacteria bacterium]|nr:hypothetical protein [Candidatus Saccharibacteria bacterium]
MKEVIKTLAKISVDDLNQSDFNDDGTGLSVTVGNIIQAVVGALGLVCVVIIILGGIQYMTSSGDAGKVKKAKDTILYGIIGLVICVLAFAITTFVINTVNNVQ